MAILQLTHREEPETAFVMDLPVGTVFAGSEFGERKADRPFIVSTQNNGDKGRVLCYDLVNNESLYFSGKERVWPAKKASLSITW